MKKAIKPESPAFKVGDLVKLKSGGPTMTVHGIEGNDPFLGRSNEYHQYYCVWFAGSKNQGATFTEEALQHAEPEEKKK